MRFLEKTPKKCYCRTGGGGACRKRHFWDANNNQHTALCMCSNLLVFDTKHTGKSADCTWASLGTHLIVTTKYIRSTRKASKFVLLYKLAQTQRNSPSTHQASDTYQHTEEIFGPGRPEKTFEKTNRNKKTRRKCSYHIQVHAHATAVHQSAPTEGTGTCRVDISTRRQKLTVGAAQTYYLHSPSPVAVSGNPLDGQPPTRNGFRRVARFLGLGQRVSRAIKLRPSTGGRNRHGAAEALPPPRHAHLHPPPVNNRKSARCLPETKITSHLNHLNQATNLQHS